MVRLSMILSVRYRNHFPVVQFQNQAHIWNPRGTGHVFKTIWGAPNSFLLFYRRRRRRKLTPRPGPPGAPNMLMAPQIFYIFFSYYSFTAAEGGGYLNGRHRHPNEGAQGTQRWRRGRHFPGGATSPLGEGNPAEGGSSRVCF